MQFSGSYDHINHLSSNFSPPLPLIGEPHRHHASPHQLSTPVSTVCQKKTRQRLPLCCVASGLAWFYDLMTCASESCSYCSISMEYTKYLMSVFYFFAHNILLHNLCSFVWFDAIKMMFVYFWFHIKSVRIGVRSQCLQFQCFVGW